jgi:hypothetical protein
VFGRTCDVARVLHQTHPLAVTSNFPICVDRGQGGNVCIAGTFGPGVHVLACQQGSRAGCGRPRREGECPRNQLTAEVRLRALFDAMKSSLRWHHIDVTPGSKNHQHEPFGPAAPPRCRGVCMKRTSAFLALTAIALTLSACGGGYDQPQVKVDDLTTGIYAVSTGDASAPTTGKYFADASGNRLLILNDSNDRASQIYRREAGKQWIAIPGANMDASGWPRRRMSPHWQVVMLPRSARALSPTSRFRAMGTSRQERLPANCQASFLHIPCPAHSSSA